MNRIFFPLFTFFFLFSMVLKSKARDFIIPARQLQIKSLSQKIVKKKEFVFEGEVEAFFDNKLHIWADRIHLDKQKMVLVAEKVDSDAIVIESNDILILADKFTLDIAKKAGEAEKIRIHVQEGYIYAEKAQKLYGNWWRIENMFYTACDAGCPHWRIGAQRAMLCGGYFIRVTGVLFKVGTMPVFVFPKMVFPIQGKSRSGFLIPKFYFDYDNGFGFKQEYYQSLGAYCDTTVGVSWRDQKGAVFSDEFRWGRSPVSFTELTGHYAIAKNSFTRKKREVLAKTRNKYWVSGKDFQTFEDILGGSIHSLARVDFGTDKKIGYQFFNSIEDVDDAFDNSWVVRLLRQSNLFELRLDSLKTKRDHFLNLTDFEKEKVGTIVQNLKNKGIQVPERPFHKKEIESLVHTVYLPHFEWNTIFFPIKDIFHYRHDVGIDHVYHREYETERFYFHSLLAEELNVAPLHSQTLLRFNYRGCLSKNFRYKRNALNLVIRPHFQARNIIYKDEYFTKNVLESRLFARGARRLFLEYGAEFAFPEGAVHNPDWDYVHYFQPIVRWNYIPKFYQDHWYHTDWWDRFYPQNQLELSLRSNWKVKDITFNAMLTQAYDFYDQSDIFYLRRGTSHKHLLPFEAYLSFHSKHVHCLLHQKFDIQKKKLLHSMFKADIAVGKVHLHFGYLFQDDRLRKDWKLFSDMPHFLLGGVAIPLGDHAILRYDGQFYSEKGENFFNFANIKPLIHRLQFEYNGHCWGVAVGYEEKKYREFGNDKRERAIVLSVRFDSLGSFAKKFKRPEIVKY